MIVHEVARVLPVITSTRRGTAIIVLMLHRIIKLTQLAAWLCRDGHTALVLGVGWLAVRVPL